MKCKHDICNNEADENSNGFCKWCVQLNSKECNYCNYKPLSFKEKIKRFFKPKNEIEEWINKQEEAKK